MSIRRLLIVDTDMTQQAIENIRRCKQDAVVVVRMNLSDLHACCGTLYDLISVGGLFTYVGVMTHGSNMVSSQDTLLNTQFIQGLQGLFPPIECRTDTCALDLFACNLDRTNPVVRRYSDELNVPIYFSTNVTGSETPYSETTRAWCRYMARRLSRTYRTGHTAKSRRWTVGGDGLDPRDVSARETRTLGS
jgi:hypothetical protein